MCSKAGSSKFQVDQIDHVELYVPDRHRAAKWYFDVLGLVPLPEYEQWANDPHGPLMIGTIKGNTKLALFQGEPSGSQAGIGFHLVAFRVESDSFVQFVAALPELKLKDPRNRMVDLESVADHQRAFSLYFCDPYGHHLELTTYQYAEAKPKLAALREPPN